MPVRYRSLALALLASLTLAAGAGHASEGVGIGLKGGLSVAILHGRLPTDGLIENGSKRGFAGGLSLTLPLGPRFSLQTEMLHTAKGTSLGRFDFTDSAGTVIGTGELLEAADYLEIPLLARFRLPSQGRAAPFVLAGPVLGMLLSQQLRLTGDGSVGIDIDIFRVADLGMIVGTGLELGAGKARGTFEVRYTLGLTPATLDSYSGDARNGAFLILAGLVLRR